MSRQIRQWIGAMLGGGGIFLGSPEGEFDAAIVGTSRGSVLYDEDLLMDCLCKTGMAVEAAAVHLNFTIKTAFYGSAGPVFMKKLRAPVRPASPYDCERCRGTGCGNCLDLDDL